MISDEELLKSAAVQDFVARIPNHGMHKIAATLYGLDEVDLYTAVQALGTKLAYESLRRQKLNEGLASYGVVTKQANFFRSLLGKTKQTAPEAAQGVAQTAGAAAPDAAQHLTHLVAGPRGPAVASRAIGEAFPQHATEIPAYARDIAQGGTFVGKELPRAPLGMDRVHADTGLGEVARKSKPTAEMAAPEMPSMFRMSESGVAPAVGKNTTNTAPQMFAGGDRPDRFGMSFPSGGAAPSGDAPAMFNLKDLMGKQASVMYKEADLKDALKRTLMGMMQGAVHGGLAGAGAGLAVGQVGGAALSGDRDDHQEIAAGTGLRGAAHGAMTGAAVGGVYGAFGGPNAANDTRNLSAGLGAVSGMFGGISKTRENFLDMHPSFKSMLSGDRAAMREEATKEAMFGWGKRPAPEKAPPPPAHVLYPREMGHEEGQAWLRSSGLTGPDGVLAKNPGYSAVAFPYPMTEAEGRAWMLSQGITGAQQKEAAIDLKQLLAGAGRGADDWRNAATYAQRAPVAASGPALGPKARDAVRNATAPSPFPSPLRQVPTPDEIAQFNARNSKMAQDMSVLRRIGTEGPSSSERSLRNPIGASKVAMSLGEAAGNTAKNLGGAAQNAVGGGSPVGMMLGLQGDQSRAGLGTMAANALGDAARTAPSWGAAGHALR